MEGALHAGLVEEPGGRIPDGEHDGGPETGRVEDGLSSLNGVQNVAGDLCRRGEERAWRQVRGHRGGDESWLDGQDLDAASVQAVAEAVEDEVEGAFGGSVDVIAPAGAVTGD